MLWEIVGRYAEITVFLVWSDSDVAGWANWYKALHFLARPVASSISICLPYTLLWDFWRFPRAQPSWLGRIRSSLWRSEIHILQMVCPCCFLIWELELTICWGFNISAGVDSPVPGFVRPRTKSIYYLTIFQRQTSSNGPNWVQALGKEFPSNLSQYSYQTYLR